MEVLQNKLVFIFTFIHLILSNVNGERKPKINNGQIARASDFKYMVAITHGLYSQCSGAIINNRFVITVAHCVYDEKNNRFKSNNFKILAATNDWSDGETGILVDVEKVYVPGFYVQRTHDADIAVLKLKSSLNIENNSNRLQALYLPQENLGRFENFGIYEFNFAGFGRSEVIPKLTNGMYTYETRNEGKLRWAKSRIITLEECQLKWNFVNDNHMCSKITQDPTGQIPYGGCGGDSGAPLVVNNVIVGVHHGSGPSCNDNDYPSVFVRVSSHLAFIKNAMNGFTSGMFVHQQ